MMFTASLKKRGDSNGNPDDPSSRFPHDTQCPETPQPQRCTPAAKTRLPEMGGFARRWVIIGCHPAASTFVEHPAATGTNNEAERTLRSPALDCKTGRTSKTPSGAKRRSIPVSVLESVKLHLPNFTLATLLAEITRWHQTGQSLFDGLLQKSESTRPVQSILEKLYPKPG